jgi:hypothetical protein
MLTSAIFGMLLGALLGIHFRVLVLAPAILLAAAVSMTTGMASGEGVRMVALAVIIASISLQSGYIAACVLRALLSASLVGDRDRPVSTRISRPV